MSLLSVIRSRRDYIIDVALGLEDLLDVKLRGVLLLGVGCFSHQFSASFLRKLTLIKYVLTSSKEVMWQNGVATEVVIWGGDSVWLDDYAPSIKEARAVSECVG